MSAAERGFLPNVGVIGVETQFGIKEEVEAARRNNSWRGTLDNILHLFAEFACKATLTNYEYLQTQDPQTNDTLLISPGFEKEGDVLNMYIRKPQMNRTRRAWLEYDGFANLREKIINTTERSFAVLVSPPGPREEGYGNYGFFYIACIPQYKQGENRKIQMYSFRVNNFDSSLVSRSTQLLHDLDPENQIPAGAGTDELLVRPITFLAGQEYQIKGEKYKIDAPFDLLSLIIAFLNLNTNKEEIEDGLVGKTLKKVHKTYRIEIQRIFNKIWSAAKGIPVKLDGRELFQVFENIPYEGGSCPAAISDPIETIKAKDSDKEEYHWCRDCGGIRSFRGDRCTECGYRLGD